MKSITGWSAITLLVTVAAFTAGATQQKEKGTQASDQQQAQKFASALEQAWNQGKFDPLKQVISEEVVFANPTGQIIEGRDQMFRVMNEDRQKFGTNAKFRVERVDTIAPGILLTDLTTEFSKEIQVPSGGRFQRAHVVAVLTQEGNTMKAREIRVFMPTPLPQTGVGGGGDGGTPGMQP